jgi:hypothetical protein
MDAGWSWCWVVSFVGLGMGCSSVTGGNDDPSGTDAPGARSAEWEGFRTLGGLGGDCLAAYALEPEAHYGPLRWIPCPSGEAGCQSLVWDGILEWDPTGSGSMLRRHFQYALDAAGDIARVLVVNRYPYYSGVEGGTPFEAVAYDFLSGAPIAAWRNVFNHRRSFEDDFGGVASGGTSTTCKIAPVLAAGSIWLYGVATDGRTVAAGKGSAGDPPAQLVPIDVDSSVLLGTAVASNGVLGLEQSDGKLARIGPNASDAAYTYGPDQRVWIRKALGDDLLVGNDDALAPLTYLLDANMTFLQHPMKGMGRRTDGFRIVWLEPDQDLRVIRVLTAPYSRDDATLASPSVVATLEGISAVSGSTVLSNGIFGFYARPMRDSPLDPITSDANLLVLVDADGGVVQRTIPSTSRESTQLLALERGHAWVGQHASTDSSAFTEIKRYSVP